MSAIPSPTQGPAAARLALDATGTGASEEASAEVTVGGRTAKRVWSRRRPGVWSLADTPVPQTARGCWCIVSCDFCLGKSALIRIEFLDIAGMRVAGLHCKLERNGKFGNPYGICYIPAEAERARPEVWGPPPARNSLAISYRPIGRAQAAVYVALKHPILFSYEFLVSNLHRPRPVREILRRAMFRALDSEPFKGDYTVWSALFGSAGFEALQDEPLAPSLGMLVFDSGSNDWSLRATLRSMGAQRGSGLPHAIVRGPGKASVEAAIASLPATCDYIGVLQSGEILAAHAALLARLQLEALGLPALVYADEDVQEPSGRRRTPLFKPEPNHMLMLSGTLSRGLWLIRRRELLAGLRELEDDATSWAETLRVSLWLGLYETGATRSGGTRRIPFVLTHRLTNAEAPPSKLMPSIVQAHLGRTGMPMEVASKWPMRLRAQPLPRGKRVSIIMPSTLGSAEVEHCIRTVLSNTQYDGLELIIGVSQPDPLTRAQSAVAARIEADPRVKVVSLSSNQFNFSWTNNQCFNFARGELILLLNDDVYPKRPNWLHAMVAHLHDPTVGVVGAKLLYPNGTVQHGGVIMGLGGLCDHAFRSLAGDAPGYAARAVLPQELSAVTGACLLIRTSLLQKLSGLDENYPSAFNDVDLCLRAREAGYAVVFAPEAVLYHLELHTYVSHYAGERAAFKNAEVERLRARWAHVVEEDPFHSPNLSLVPAREWEPAFPPRVLF
jgi:GT2 family glycosyltransferase